jgi:hypothetical protein
MAKLARERIDRLAPKQVVAELLAFYEEVINRKRGERPLKSVSEALRLMNPWNSVRRNP